MKKPIHDLPNAPGYQFKGANPSVIINRGKRLVNLTTIGDAGIAALLKEDEAYWSTHFNKKTPPEKKANKTEV